MTTRRFALRPALVLLCLLCAPGAPAALPWESSLEHARQQIEKSGQPGVFFLFSGRADMERVALALLDSPLIEGFALKAVWVKVNITESGGRTMAREHKVYRVPCVLVIDRAGKELARLQGDEITASTLPATLERVLGPAVRPAATPAPTPVATAGVAAPGAPAGAPAGERQLIVGWTQVQSVDANGDARGIYNTRPIVIEKTPPSPPGTWVYFSDLVDMGSYLKARFAPAPTILKEPPPDPATGMGLFEVGQWYDAVIEEMGRSKPAGVARLKGKVTFVPDTAIGDHVIIELTSVDARSNDSRLVYKYPPEVPTATPTPTPTPAPVFVPATP